MTVDDQQAIDRERALQMISESIERLMDLTDSVDDRIRFGRAICSTVVAKVARHAWAHKMHGVKVRDV